MTTAPPPDRREMLRDALLAIDELQAKLDAADASKHEPIAIVGMSCRFPGGADSPEAYWDLLTSGIDAVSAYPAERAALLEASGVELDGPIDYPGGFLDTVDQFDPAFFGISPREAASMDPQQRMVLETSWEALERAAIAPDSLRGSRTGIFVGITGTEYVQLGKLAGPETLDVYSATGGALNAAPGRVAFTLGLQGPSVAIDTACSSSLVAIHQACTSLRTGESELALAGGVNLLLLPEAFVTFERWGMMAPDGRCKTFDAAADGFVRSEGCGMIALKRLSDAQADGDPIVAVIRGSAVNQDGASSGLTVPNGPAQEAVLRTALANARVAPADIQYFEAHGTGTTLGDPIEVEAMGAVLGAGRTADQPLRLGSVKTNLGHLESAAGIAGLMKVVLAMQHGQIPPHLHLNERSPQIPWPAFDVEIPTEITPWPGADGRRFAGVSGFGFSGTNAHIVLESAPASPAVPAIDADVAMLRAGSPAGLAALAGRVAALPDEAMGPALATLASARAALPDRAVVTGNDPAELRHRLQTFAAGDDTDGVTTGVAGRSPRIGFLFTGQGSQYPKMASALRHSEPVFAAALEAAAAKIDARLAERLPNAMPLLDVIDGNPDPTLIHRTGYTQPAIFAIQHALTELWASWGVRPAAVLGHSIGEIAAAVTAGVFDLDAAIDLVTARGALMEALPDGGAMAAVAAPRDAVEAILAELDGPISIAAINGPANTVISGRGDLVDTAAARLGDLGRNVTRLDVSHAFHSPLMEPMADAFASVTDALAYAAPSLAMFSTVTGAAVRDDIATADYWRRHVHTAVRFVDAIEAMAADGIDVFVEVGPHPVLSANGQASVAATWLPSLRRNVDDRQQILGSLGSLDIAGASIDWSTVYGTTTRVTAPTTPFERRSHWFAPVTRRPRARSGGHPLLGPATRVPSLEATVHETDIAIDAPAWLQDHRLGGTVVFPGTGYLDVVLSAVDGAPVESLSIRQPLVFSGTDPVALQTTVVTTNGRQQVTVGSHADDRWTVHAEASIATASAPAPDHLDLPSIPERFAEPVDITAYYRTLDGLGLDYGPAFTGLRAAHRGDDEAIGEVELGDDVDSSEHHRIHPALLDACFHTLGVAVGMDDENVGVPVRLGGITLHRPVGRRAWCHARLVTRRDDGGSTAAITVYDADGAPALEIAALDIHPTSTDAWSRLGQTQPDALYTLEWRGQGRGDEALDRRLLLLGSDPLIEPLRAAAGATAATGSLDPDELDRRLTEAGDGLDVVAFTDDAWTLAALGQRIAAHSGVDARLVLVSRGATSVAGESPDPAAAAAWGCGASLAVELEQRFGGSVDLDPTPRHDDVDEVLAELTSDGRERAVALRGGRRFVSRLARPTLRPRNGDRRVVLTGRGSVDQLTLASQDAPEPGANQIQVRVASSGLNFRDVLNVLGMFPGDPGPPGLECAGVVTAVGDGVTTLSIGDRVVGIAQNAYDDIVVTDATLMARLPAGVTFAEGASIPIAFMTATYGLERLAGLRAGERVLIHAGTGGVGMAAIQVAQRIGAEVFATAGTDAKRDLLRRLGVDHVYDSRTLDFAGQIRDDTEGAGIDVALNSLADEFVTTTFDLLADGGRFLEIGKRGILSPDDATARRADVAYHPYDLADFLALDPDDIHTELERVVGLISAGDLRPLPVRAFAHDDIADAFRFMAQARHIGKVVIDHHRVDDIARADGTYLVTGGLGGLGLAMGSWLAANGAGRVVLASRREPDTETRAAIDTMAAGGTEIETVALDMNDAEAVAAAIRDLGDHAMPLRGVVHAAGINDDAALSQQRAERFTAVAGPKVGGTLALDAATRSLDLDWFVAFSSASAIFGSAGQSNYAAANRAMDAVMLRRAAAGLPALTINWGAWADVGMAARLPEAQQRRLAAGGIRAIGTGEAIDTFEAALTAGLRRAVIGGFDWPTVSAATPEPLRPLIDELTSGEGGVARRAVPDIDVYALLDAEDPGSRQRALQGVVADSLTAVLGLDAGEQVDPDRGLSDLGMDSLMAVELSNRLAALLDLDLASTIALEYATVRALTEHLVTILADRVDFGGADADGNGDALATMDTDALTSALLDELDDVGY